ncbi:MAG: hypothetical protein CBC29_03440 [Methylococcaceae bacterium TMED69]|nr:MAG: hypothetical protein CBC29_03440 [Methylococcaceae bacterium TMED69]|tara:strand:- start:3024 stop:3329 length:306 start_codon:yes stop_codon:yes gene_type:complete
MNYKVSPAVSSKQLETDVVKVTRWDFAPYSETGWHIHDFDYIVIPVISGQLTIINPDGLSTKFDIFQGNSYNRRAGVEHNVQNLTDNKISFLEIEFKSGIE